MSRRRLSSSTAAIALAALLLAPLPALAKPAMAAPALTAGGLFDAAWSWLSGLWQASATEPEQAATAGGVVALDNGQGMDPDG